MKVRLLRPTAINNQFYLTGSIVDVQTNDANMLISRGTAEMVEDNEPETEPKKDEPKKRKPGRPAKTKEDKPDMIKFEKFTKGGVIVDNGRDKNKK